VQNVTVIGDMCSVACRQATRGDRVMLAVKGDMPREARRLVGWRWATPVTMRVARCHERRRQRRRCTSPSAPRWA